MPSLTLQSERILSDVTLRPRLVGIKQAAKLLGIGLTSTWSLVADKRITVVRIGGRTLVVLASIDALVDSLVVAAREQRDDARQ
jgi:excisionase family DNA binding protein